MGGGDPGRVRLRGRRLRSERGATAVETVIVAPTLLLMLMGIVQVGLLFHAQNVAEQAAQEGAAAARRFDGSPGAGRVQARSFLDQVGGQTLTGTGISARRTTTRATVTVSGTVVSVVPFLRLPVREQAAGPVERYVPTSESGGGS